MLKCCECGKETKVVFDGRFHGQTTTLYVVKENGKNPIPTGFCKKCFKDWVCQDIDHMEKHAT